MGQAHASMTELYQRLKTTSLTLEHSAADSASLRHETSHACFVRTQPLYAAPE